MAGIKAIAKVPIPEAVLFIPPDGVDRDPDFSNTDNMQSTRLIRAADYIKLKNSDESPEWMSKPYRLYCPCCFEKGHLSRHYAQRNHDRSAMAWNGQTFWQHVPDRFQKWPGDEHNHSASCDHADRYTPLSSLQRDVLTARKEVTEAPKHTITLPINGDIVLMPPRGSLSKRHRRDEEIGNTRMSAVSPASSKPRLKTFQNIHDIERFLRASYYDPAARATEILVTPFGDQSLDKLYLNSVQAVFMRCEEMYAQKEKTGLVLISLRPNRRPEFWEGRKFPSVTGPSLPHDPKRRAVVMFNAQNETAQNHLVELFKRTRAQADKKLLAYGEICRAVDGRPNILIHRPEQIMNWDEPEDAPSLFSAL